MSGRPHRWPARCGDPRARRGQRPHSDDQRPHGGNQHIRDGGERARSGQRPCGGDECARGGQRPCGGDERARGDQRTRGGDQGVATVLAVALVVVLLAAVVVVVHLGAVAVARRRAEAAADLAALGGAGQVVAGRGCAAAGRVAGEMGGRLAECAVDGWVVTVRVEVELPGVLSMFGATSARARAGPAEV
ncbi:Rv3654c family TadE-like protein [Crossiella sp. NPDC003009]